jgi:hypothetical protein
LMLATVATLLFVPVIFSLLHRTPVPKQGGTEEPKQPVPSTRLSEAVPAT